MRAALLQHALLTRHLPLGKTPHKAGNGELSITCRNRHCPKCQTAARNKWLAARQQELLAVGYFHVVFTLPQELSPLALQNKQAIYSLLFHASAETLLEVAGDPKHLGAEVGPEHLAYMGAESSASPARSLRGSGGRPFERSFPLGTFITRLLSPGHSTWPRVSRQVRRRVEEVAPIRETHLRRQLKLLSHSKPFSVFLRTLFRKDWVVYSKRPFGGPEHVLHHLARYTHRVAISNHRLITFG